MTSSNCFGIGCGNSDCCNCNQIGKAEFTPYPNYFHEPIPIEAVRYPKVTATKTKFPHKCPLCEGSGKTLEVYPALKDDCHACEGKGIVWG